MATTYHFITLANADAAYDLLTPAIITELREDFGFREPPSRSRLRAMLNDPDFRIVGARDNGTAQGGAIGERLDDGRWSINLVWVTETLSAQQRAVIFRGMMRFAATGIPGATRFFGVMPEGRRLDLLLQMRGFTDRKIVAQGENGKPNHVEYNTTAQEILDLL